MVRALDWRPRFKALQQLNQGKPRVLDKIPKLLSSSSLSSFALNKTKCPVQCHPFKAPSGETMGFKGNPSPCSEALPMRACAQLPERSEVVVHLLLLVVVSLAKFREVTRPVWQEDSIGFLLVLLLFIFRYGKRELSSCFHSVVENTVPPSHHQNQSSGRKNGKSLTLSAPKEWTYTHFLKGIAP